MCSKSSSYELIYIPYSGKFLEINSFGNYNEKCTSEITMKNVFQKLNFEILSYVP